MATQTSDVREVKDPAEEISIDYAVELTIPTTAESLKCGVRLASEGEGYYLSDWWVKGSMSGEGSFSHSGELLGSVPDIGEEIPFSTRRGAALTAAERLLIKLEEIDPNDDSKAQDDVTRFMLAAEIGEVPKLDEPEGDSLPSGERPLSELDELNLSRQFIAEEHAQAKEVRRLKAIWVDLKAETSAAKKKLENAQDAHTELSLTRVADLREDFQNDVESRPLIDPTQNPAIADNQPDPALSEPWRAVLIADLIAEFGLSAHIVDKLAENPGQAITTLGELSDFEDELGKKGIDNPLCGIPGIGITANDKICTARMEWFRQHPPEGEGPLKEGE